MSNHELDNYPLTYTNFSLDCGPVPGLPLLSDTAIILGNHMASSVFIKDGGELGDAGRKARGVAMRTGYPVIVYNRIGTGPDAKELIVDPKNVADVTKYTGEKLNKIVEAFGFKHIILGGNSADATAAACLAASETMPVSHLVAMDPVGMHTIQISRAYPRWLHYNLREERKAPKSERPPDDLASEAVGFDPFAFRQDSRAYRRIWETRIAGVALENIAGTMGQIATRLEIPDHTFTGSLDDNRQFMQDLVERRSQLATTKPEVALFTAVEVNGYHSAYENFRVYSDCIARVINPDFVGFES